MGVIKDKNIVENLFDHPYMKLNPKPRCPFCKTLQEKHWLRKSWKYGKVSVERYECKCGKIFNFYMISKSNWTIPKKK